MWVHLLQLVLDFQKRISVLEIYPKETPAESIEMPESEIDAMADDNVQIEIEQNQKSIKVNTKVFNKVNYSAKTLHFLYFSPGNF